MHTHRDVIGGEDPGEAASAICDFELGAVGLVRGRLAAVVLVVQRWNDTEELSTDIKTHFFTCNKFQTIALLDALHVAR